MINVSELMIGDWVYDGERTQFPMYIETIARDYVYLNFKGNEGDVWESTLQELQGIPLTPELMAKIGFTFSNGLWRKREHNRNIQAKIETGFVFVEAFNETLKDSRGCSHNIHYLHQLQNFFRIISRKELIFEL